MTQFSVKVMRKQREADDIVSFELASTDGSALPPFSAGSHIDVFIRDGLVRQYSLCNDPSEQHRYLIGVLRDPASRGGSVAMHDDVAEGATLRISAPKNHFALTPAARTILFAGGIGITPILCMAERLAETHADFELHYCTRSSERTAFQARIAASSFAGKVHFHFDAGPAQQKLDLANVIAQPDAGSHLYVCGPGGFIDHVTSTARNMGWGSAQVHLEYFSAQVRDTSADQPFEVKLASSGQCYTIPADRSIVEVLAGHGIVIPMVCEEGICGTCITRVLEGVPDHRDQYFTPEEQAENNQFTPCCSRARSATLVLDL